MTTDTLSRPALPDTAADALHFLAQRRSVGAAFLRAPGPDTNALAQMLAVAARVPDHGALVPWRFIVVEADARAALTKQLQAACLASAGEGSDAKAQADKTVEKIGRLFGNPPLVVIVVSCPDPAAKIPVFEQVLSAGAVCMNLMQAATVLGFAANWLTGWTATHPAARNVLGLRDGETVAGIIPIGTAVDVQVDRPRPNLPKVVTRWGE